MNKVQLNGKIIDIKTREKVTYATLLCHNGKGKPEFIPVTIFNNIFFNRYFYKDKWVAVSGYLQMNGHDKTAYKKMEVIVEEIFFSGDASEIDHMINQELAKNQTPL